jgi:hypothetical protein
MPDPVLALTTTQALWLGLAGASAVVLTQIVIAGERHAWPWEANKLRYFVVSSVARLLLGCGLAALFQMSHQISGIFGALFVGVGAPVIVSRLLALTNEQQVLADVAVNGVASQSDPPAVSPAARAKPARQVKGGRR